MLLKVFIKYTNKQANLSVVCRILKNTLVHDSPIETEENYPHPKKIHH